MSRWITIWTALLFATASFAASGTWTNGTLWSNADNWTGASAPGSGETATFDGQGTSSVDLGAGVTLGSIKFSGSQAYTIGTGSSQSLGITAWAGIDLQAGNLADQTIVASMSPASSQWDNDSANTLIVSGDVTGNANLWFDDGAFNFTSTNNTRTGGCRIKGGAEVSASSWNSSGFEQYHGTFTMNFSDTRDLSIGRTDAAGTFTYGIGSGYTNTLSNHLTYTAATNGTANVGTITGGTVALGTTWRTATINDNTNITGQDAELIIASDIHGGASQHLTKNGDGTLRLTGTNNTSTGFNYLFVQRGKLQIERDENIGRSHLVMGNTGHQVPSTLEFIGKSSTTINNDIRINCTNGVDHIVLANGASGAALTLSNFHNNWANGGGKFVIGGTNTDANTVSADMGEMDLLVDGVDKTGAGTWQITAAQTYTGPTEIEGGRLDIDNTLVSAITVFNGAILGGEGSSSANVTIGTASGAGKLAVDGSTAGSFSTTGTLDTTNGVSVIIESDGTDPIKVIDFTGGSWNGVIGDFSVDPSSTVDLSDRGFVQSGSAIYVYPPQSITWNGADTTNPTYWNVDGATNWSSVDGKFFSDDAVTFGDTSAGTVDLQAALTPASVAFTNTSGNDFSLINNSLSATGGVSITADGNVSVASQITGATALDKTAASDGTLTLNGANTYSGGTTLNCGETIVSNSAAFGSGTVTLEDGAGSSTIPVITLKDGVNVANDLTVTDAGDSWVKALRLVDDNTSAYATWSGDITSAELSYNAFQLGAQGSSRTLELAGNVTAPGMQFFNYGSGTIYLTGSNTISGTIHVRQWGTKLRIGNSNALNGGADVIMDERSQVQLDDGVTTASDATLTVGTVGGSWKRLEVLSTGGSESATFAGPITINYAVPGNFDVQSPTDDTLTLSGVINTPGAAGIDKTGDGDLILTAANTITNGLVDVQAGGLWINGDSSGSDAPITVASGATIAGTGAWGGTITNESGSKLAWRLTADTTTTDSLDVTGSLILQGANTLTLSFNDSGSTVDWTDTFWDSPHAWTVATAGTLTGFGNLSITTENWLDSNGAAFDTEQANSEFRLVQDGNSILLEFHIPGSATWTGTDSDLWNRGVNWDAGIPGSGNAATFNGAGNGNTTVDLGSGATVGSLVFDTASCAAYTIGTGSVQSLTIDNWAGIDLRSDCPANQTIAASMSVANSQWDNDSVNTLIVSGDVSGTGNIYFDGGTFNLTSTNNTRTGQTRVLNGAQVAANSWNTAASAVYQGEGKFTQNYDSTQGLTMGRDEATGDFTYEIGSGKTVTLNNHFYYYASTNAGVANVGIITNGTVALNTTWRNAVVEDNANITGTDAELIIASDINGSGGVQNLTKQGGGTLRLTGNNSTEFNYLGLQEGKVQFESDANFGDNRVNWGNGANATTLEFIGDASTDVNNYLSLQADAGVEHIILANGASGAALTWSGGEATWGGLTGDSVTLGGTNTDNNVFQCNLTKLTNTLTKAGSGTWTIGGSTKTFTAATTIEAGRLNIACAVASAITVGDGTTLGGEGSTSANVVFGTSTTSKLAVDASTGAAFGTTANLNTANGVSVIVETAGSDPIKVIEFGTWTGDISDFSIDASGEQLAGGQGFVEENGAIYLYLEPRDVTWSGADVANSTHWDVNTSTNWSSGNGKYFNNDTVTFGDTGAGAVDLQAALTPASVAFTNTSGNDFSLMNNSLSATGGVSISADGDVAIASQITGATAVDKTAASDGTLTLSGANTYSGGTTLNCGETVVSNSAAFGSGTVTLEDGAGSATIPVITLKDGVNVTNDLTVTDGGDSWVKALRLEDDNTSAYATWSGDIASAELSYNAFKLGAQGSSRTLELAGNVTAPGVQLFSYGSGTIYLTGSNTISGTVHVRQWGTKLRIGNDNALNGGADVIMDERCQVQLDDGVTTASDATLTVGTVGGSWKRLEVLSTGGSESATFAGPITINYALPGNFDVQSPTDDTLTLSGIINTPSTAGIDKTGDGDLVLTAANTITNGLVDVQGGALWINGDSSGSDAPITVASGATIAGTGAWGGTITNESGSKLAWSLASDTTSTDALNVTGSLILQGGNTLSLSFNGSGSTVDWTDTFWDTPRQWTIATAGTLTGFGNLTLTTENWLDSNSAAFDTERPNSEFQLVQSGNSILLEFQAPGDAAWTGADGDEWNRGVNWDAGVPGAANTATFNGAGNGNTTVDLGSGASVTKVEFTGASCAAYTLGTNNNQTLGLAGWTGIDLASSLTTDQTIAATVDLTAHNQWNNASPNTLTVSGDVTGSGKNLWLNGGAFNFTSANNTRSGSCRVFGGAAVTASSWDTSVIETYEGSFTRNFDTTQSLDIGHVNATGDFTYGIGAGYTNTLNDHLTYTPASGVGNVATITGGTLNLGTTWRLIEVNDNAAVTGQDAELVIHSELYGGDTYHFSKRGLGTLRLTATNNAAGRGYRYLFIDEGTLQIEKDENLGRIQVTLGRAGYTTYNALEFIGDTSTTINNEIKIAGTNGVNHNVLANGASGATLTLSAFHNNWANGGDKFTLGGTNTDANTVSADMGIMDGLADGVDKNGVGTWRITAAQTYTGPTTIQTGRLDVASTLTSPITVWNGATLGGEGSTSSNVTFGTSTTSTLAIAVSTTGAFGTTAILDTGNGVSVLVDATPYDLVKVIEYGTLSGSTNDFSIHPDGIQPGPRGATFSTSGGAVWLDLGYGGRTWEGADGSNPTYWDVSTSENWAEGDKKYSDGDEVGFGDTGSGTVDLRAALAPATVTFTNTSGNNYSLINNSLSASSGISVDADGNVDIASQITGATAVDKTAASDGILTLQGANTYSGGTTLNCGETIVSNSAAFGTGTVTLEDASGSATTPTITLSDAVSVSNALTLTDAGDSWVKVLRLVSANSTAHATWAGDITSAELSYNAFQLGAGGGNQILELAGNVTAPGMQIFQQGGGTVYLTGSNTISGTVHVRQWGSKLRIGNDNALNGGATVIMDERCQVQLDDGVTTPSSASLTVGTVGGSWKRLEVLSTGGSESATFAGPITINYSVPGNFDVQSPTDDTLTLSGIINTPGTAGIDKTGDGDLVLTAANTITNGLVDVQAGGLWINGDSSGSDAPITVASGATIAGTGAWGGSITNESGSKLAWSLTSDTTSTDALDVTGSLILQGGNTLSLSFNGSGSTVDWTDTFWDSPHVWTVATAGTLTGFGNLTLTTEDWADSNAASFDTVVGGEFQLVQDGNSIVLEFYVPGDATWTGATNDLWARGMNWDAGVPGSANTATFNGAGNGNTTIDLGSGASLGAIVFDDAACAAYTLGTSGAQSLSISQWGGIDLADDNANDQTIAAALSVGSSQWDNDSANTLVVSGDISGTGNIWFDDGTFSLTSANNTRTGQTRIMGGAEVTASSWNTTAQKIEQYEGKFIQNYSATAALDMGNANATGDFTHEIGAGYTNTLNENLDYTAAGNGTANVATITGGTLNWGTTWRSAVVEDNPNITGQDAELIIASEIYGGNTYHVGKSGAGTLRLTATNNSGTTGFRYLFINEGVLQIEKDENLGNFMVTLGNSGLTSYNALEFIGDSSTTIDNEIKISGVNGVNHNVLANGANGAALTLSNFHDNWGGVQGTKFTLGGTNTDANTVSDDMGDMDSLPDGMVKAGTGKWVLDVAQTYTGDTTVNGGTLVMNGDISNTAGVDVNSGGTLEVNAALTSADVSINSGSVLDLNTAGSISGAALTISNAATTVLDGSLNSSAITAHSGVTLQLGADERISGSSAVVLEGGATLDLNGASYEGIGTLTGGGLITNSGAVFSTLTVNSGASDTTFSGSIKRSAAGNISLTKNGSGTLTLTGSSDYQSVSIYEGTIAVTTGEALGTGWWNKLGYTSDGTLEFVGSSDVTMVANQQLSIGYPWGQQTGGGVLKSSLSGSARAILNIDTRLNATPTVARTLTLTGDNANNNEITGAVQNQNASGGTIAVTKTDSGKWMLSGANTYTGATTVEAGRLDIAGSITSELTVNDDATLGGEGSSSANVIIGDGSGAGILAVDGSTEAAFGTSANLNTANGVSVLIEDSGTQPIKVIEFGTWTGNISDFSVDPAGLQPTLPGGFYQSGNAIYLTMEKTGSVFKFK